MPRILFLPDNRAVEAPPGTPLQEAARQAGITISLPCAGKGVCGKCLVKVREGALRFRNHGRLPEELERKGFVLACRSLVGEVDATIEAASTLEEEKGQFSDALSRIGINEALFPREEDIRPLVRAESLAVSPPYMLDGLGDLDRFTQAVRETFAVEDAELPLDLLRKLPDLLRERDGAVMAWCAVEGERARVVDIAAEEEPADYGLAVDVGTTTVALQLVDMGVGRVLDTFTLYNAQIDRGEDIISRISYAKNPGRIRELRELVISTVNKGIDVLRERNGAIPASGIRNMALAANTTMAQLFLGINPQYIRLEPYTPAVMGIPRYRARELGVAISPDTPVWMAPNVGSYVGGDITAGLLCTDFALDTEEICLFIDIGTNGEIVLGNNEFLMGCACSAGPAFEGGGIEMGMRASHGAVERVEIDPGTGECAVSVIGGGEPKGICGSGLIFLIAELFDKGLIDPKGKLDRSGRYASIRAEGKNARYYLRLSGEGDQGIYITENDIDNFIRAKAAIFSACLTMLNSVELNFDCISRFYIAGGFGRYIPVDRAQTLGLLPRLPEERFRYVGNASLTGSFMALISGRHREKLSELAGRITYVDLSTEPGYMDEYVAAMFLPHTNEKLFPL